MAKAVNETDLIMEFYSSWFTSNACSKLKNLEAKRLTEWNFNFVGDP